MTTLNDGLREILRDGAFGHYATDENHNFIPLDWSETPNSYFEPYIQQILALIATKTREVEIKIYEECNAKLKLALRALVERNEGLELASKELDDRLTKLKGE